MSELTEKLETITISLELYRMLLKDSRELDTINNIGLLSGEDRVYIDDTIEYEDKYNL